jgi:excisionase family DNA binding protein
MKGAQMQAEITREWITYKQAEELSGLSRTTLWKLLSAGEIKAARIGRAVRINRRSLDEYLERAAEDSWLEGRSIEKALRVDRSLANPMCRFSDEQLGEL